jgi:hypothetical protein
VTKIAAAVILREDGLPIMERWTSSNVATDPKVAEQIKQFFAKRGVKNVVVTDGIIGCPHEEGDDFPVGQECPFCPFWEGKQGIILTTDDDEEDEEPENMTEEIEDEADEDGSGINERAPDAIDRFEAIAGENVESSSEAIDNILAYLRTNLMLPCEVEGIEDFRWEEPYVIGGWSPREYKKLKKTQPSYTDKYQLLSIDHDDVSEWMMFSDEDISAHVRRISDGKEFVLGLAELKATDKRSQNYRLLDDYSIWLVNSR